MSQNNNKTKVKTVPYLFDLFTIRHFSLTSVNSESVGYAFVAQPLRFYMEEMSKCQWGLFQFHLIITAK